MVAISPTEKKGWEHATRPHSAALGHAKGEAAPIGAVALAAARPACYRPAVCRGQPTGSSSRINAFQGSHFAGGDGITHCLRTFDLSSPAQSCYRPRPGLGRRQPAGRQGAAQHPLATRRDGVRLGPTPPRPAPHPQIVHFPPRPERRVVPAGSPPFARHVRADVSGVFRESTHVPASVWRGGAPPRPGHQGRPRAVRMRANLGSLGDTA